MDKKKFGENDKPAQRSFKNEKMREEIAMEMLNPDKYKEMVKLRERKYAGPKQYREAVIETYRSSVSNQNTDK
jgi:hypothetical protein